MTKHKKSRSGERAGLGSEGRRGCQQRKGPESSAGQSLCSHCMLQRLQTQQSAQPSDVWKPKGGAGVTEFGSKLKWGDGSRERGSWREREKIEVAQSEREKKQFVEWKTAWKSPRCFPWNPAVHELLSNNACACPEGTITPRPPLRAQPDERVAKGGLGGLALNPPPSVEVESAVAPFTVAREGRKRQLQGKKIVNE